MKNKILLLILIKTSLIFSQEIYKINYTFTDKNDHSSKSSLVTDNKESTFKIYDDRERGIIDGNDNKAYIVENDLLSKMFYTNNTLSYYRFPIYNTEIIYSDLYEEKTNWLIKIDNKRQIGKYDCTEAKLNLNGRNYTAWFTFDVPIKFGPLKFHELPGLIVELLEDKGFLKLTLQSVEKTKDLTELQKIKKYFLNKKKVLNYYEYEKQILDIEIPRRIRMINSGKEAGDKGVSFDNYATLDFYMEIPSRLLIELKKTE